MLIGKQKKMNLENNKSLKYRVIFQAIYYLVNQKKQS